MTPWGSGVRLGREKGEVEGGGGVAACDGVGGLPPSSFVTT